LENHAAYKIHLKGGNYIAIGFLLHSLPVINLLINLAHAGARF